MDWFKRNSRALLFLACLLAAWAAVTALRLIDPIVLPSPWSVARAVPGMLRERLLADIGLTLGRVLTALVFACVLGIPAGLFLGYRKRTYEVLEGPLHALRSIPASALFPLFLIVAGVGETSIVALAAYPSLLVILVNAVSGTALANQRRLYQARLLNLSRPRFHTPWFSWLQWRCSSVWVNAAWDVVSISTSPPTGSRKPTVPSLLPA